MDVFRYPHRRLNILTGEWVLVSPGRLNRPWRGEVESLEDGELPEYDPDCYMCPGNLRAGGRRNPDYSGTYVFDNDFPAVFLDVPSFRYSKGMLRAVSERGICRVVCFSPRHNLTLAEMGVDEIERVVDTWAREYFELCKLGGISYVLIFENKGRVMGCSNPHPHGQIWATESIPVEPLKEIEAVRSYDRCILCEYLEFELSLGERVVCLNDDFVVLVPFWAIWPYEVMIVSRRHFGSFNEMREFEKVSFSDVLRRILVRYDNLFEVSFPYSSGIHQSPVGGLDKYHFHMHFYPPLLSSGRRKFLVGFEMLGNPQRDITAEEAAKVLASKSEVHYKNKVGGRR